MFATNPVLTPLSVTVETALRRAYLPTLRQAGPLAQPIAHQAEASAEEEQMEARFGQTRPGLPKDIINFLHDPLARAIALGRSEGTKIRELPLRLKIQDGWLRQYVDPDRGRPIRVVTQVDGNRFSEDWLALVCASQTCDHRPPAARPAAAPSAYTDVIPLYTAHRPRDATAPRRRRASAMRPPCRRPGPCRPSRRGAP
ncbi:MAG: hypothetical protein KatS3mg048_3792 [Caldilinea sp.]|nr:MAG: hypothetical protein KatS3mg048_3792 [Caldilinea sp.]